MPVSRRRFAPWSVRLPRRGLARRPCDRVHARSPDARDARRREWRPSCGCSRGSRGLRSRLVEDGPTSVHSPATCQSGNRPCPRDRLGRSDGKQIVFTRTTPTRSAIYTVGADGRGERLLVGDARGAAWSADGRSLAFVDGVLGDGRPLTLSVISMPDRRLLMRTPLRRPLDVEGLSAQAWRR